MNRHPCEYFIKYILSLPDSKADSDDFIRDGITKMGFPAPEGLYIAGLRQQIKDGIPDDYHPEDRYHRESALFLKKEEIYGLYHPDESVEAAMMILRRPKHRKLLETLLLGRLTSKDAAKKLNSRFEVYYTEDDVQSYYHYFWNVGLLTIDEWVDFFDAYEKAEKHRSKAIINGGPSMALRFTGFQQQLESKEMLREMMEGLYFDFKQWEQQPLSRDKTTAMTSIAKASTQVDVRLSEADSALRDSLKAFEQFRMKHAESGVQALKDVAPAGNFTESGSSLRELPPKEDDS